MTKTLPLEGIIATLRTTYFFRDLGDADLRKVASFVHTKSLSKGEYLFHHGEPTSGFFIVRTGAINVHRISPDGREQVIHIFRPGESLAEAALTGDSGYPADAKAALKSDVIFVPKNEMLHLLEKNPELALRMLGSLSMHLRTLVNALDDLTLKDAETRLIQWLLKHCPKPLSNKPATFDLGVSKTVLAAELSARNETLSRIFSRFKNMKWISLKGSSITVTSPLMLSKMIHPTPGKHKTCTDA